jgi:type II secretory pathway component PulF
MPAYTYEALTEHGVTERGVLEADSERAARSQLRTQALIPLKLEAVATDKPRLKGTWCCGKQGLSAARIWWCGHDNSPAW